MFINNNLVLDFFENKKILVNTKSDIASNKSGVEEKINLNNNNLNAPLANLNTLIQKMIEENKKNQQQNDINDFNSSNSMILNNENQNNHQNSNSEKKKNIEVKKKNINLKRNLSNKFLYSSPNRNIYSGLSSNLYLNTMSNLKNTNFRNYEKNKLFNQEDKNIAQSVYLDDKDKNKLNLNKKKSYLNNKSVYSFDFKKGGLYNLPNKKPETSKNTVNKKPKSELNFNNLNIKKTKSIKTRSNSKKKKTSKEKLNSLVEDSKIKEENRESIITKNNKIYNIGVSNRNNNNLNLLNNMRNTFQKLNLNSDTNNNNGNKKSRSKSNHNKSLSHNPTKINLKNKNKPNITNNNININNTLNYNYINKENNLSNLEKSYLILSKSPILRLSERLIFSRSTNNLRNVQSISDILKKNEKFLKDKIKELEGRIAECDKRINTSFNPSKTAEINFNFILSKDEEEFKNFIYLAENEKEKTEFYCYTKIIYLLFNENYENIEAKNLTQKLYLIVNKNGFKTVREYMYSIYFKKKDDKEKNNIIIYNIDKINSLIEEVGLDQKFNVKFCRFALFTSFLIKEIIKYGNEIKNMVELKVKTKEFIDVINNKLELFKVSNFFKKK